MTRRLPPLVGRLALLLITLATLTAPAQPPAAVRLGAGGYATAPPPGARRPQQDIHRVPGLRGPTPTNDWWSSLAWERFSDRQYPHPLAVQAGPRGLRVRAPGPSLRADATAIFATMPDNTGDDLVIGLADPERAGDARIEFPDARLESFSDWFVTARFDQSAGQGGGARLGVSYGHGSPFVYATCAGAAPAVTFAAPPRVFAGANARPAGVLAVTVNDRHYALFGPAGAGWVNAGGNTFVNRGRGGHVSVALLPDDKPETLALFTRAARHHVTGTTVDWRYDPNTATLTTEYRFTFKSYDGPPADPLDDPSADPPATLFALYPHQWRNAPAATPFTGHAYPSVRGVMKLARGDRFTTAMKFPGLLPSLPVAPDAAPELRALLAEEAAAPPPPVKDTYWEGKHLGKLATLLPLAEQLGDRPSADQLHARLRSRLEHWLAAPDKPRAGLFHYDANWGTLIGHPASFGSDVELNDHHFHYGYFLKAAAELARRDPAWAAEQNYGPMLRLLVRDVASPDRADPLFPFLRNFDPYAGHSWASGHARFGDGNNNESSSEAMNAWAALILLGQSLNDTKLRDLGVYLYTTEMHAIHEYWFDVHAEHFPRTYTPSVVTMVWGGKGANATWFSDKPPIVHGINFLPLHGASLYLGHHAAYAKKNYNALVAENKSDDFRDWPDIAWMFRALSDPADALRLYRRHADTARLEAGNTRANTLHWITTLNALGRPDPAVTADHPLAVTFLKDRVRTYAAWNTTTAPLTVTFSDGFRLTLPPHQPATARR